MLDLGKLLCLYFKLDQLRLCNTFWLHLNKFNLSNNFPILHYVGRWYSMVFEGDILRPLQCNGFVSFIITNGFVKGARLGILYRKITTKIWQNNNYGDFPMVAEATQMAHFKNKCYINSANLCIKPLSINVIVIGKQKRVGTYRQFLGVSKIRTNYNTLITYSTSLGYFALHDYTRSTHVEDKRNKNCRLNDRKNQKKNNISKLYDGTNFENNKNKITLFGIASGSFFFLNSNALIKWMKMDIHQNVVRKITFNQWPPTPDSAKTQLCIDWWGEYVRMFTCRRVVQGQLCVPKHGGVAQLNADCQWSVCSLHAHPFPGTPVYVDATCFQHIQSEQITTMFPNKLNVVFECNDIF
ncbi:hypothetical protein QTP88_014439 [Uroleucon formosanum]